MRKKRNLEITFSIILTIILITAVISLANLFYAEAKEGSAAFSYTVCLTDNSGSEIESISSLKNGEKFTLDIILSRDDITEDHYDDIWAYETGFTGYGLKFDADSAYKYVSQMTSKATEWSINNTLTVEYLFVNYYPVGEKIKCYGVTTKNPQKTLSGTFTITDENRAQLALDIFIISLTEDFDDDPTTHYIPVQKNVKFHLDDGGGKLSDDVSGVFDEGDKIVLPTVKRAGYDFCGWKYSDEVYGKNKIFEGEYIIPGGVCGTLEMTPVWKAKDEDSSQKNNDNKKDNRNDDNYASENIGQNGGSSENYEGSSENNEQNEDLSESTAQNDESDDIHNEPEDIDFDNVTVNVPALKQGNEVAYLSGYPDNTIRPSGNLTRAELSAIFYRLLKDDVREGNSFMESGASISEYEGNEFDGNYIDISDKTWYLDYAKTLTRIGILNGYPDNSFRGDRYITRAEFITAAVRFAIDVRDETKEEKSDIRDDTAIAKYSETREISEVAEIPELSEISEVAEISEASEISEVAEISKISKTPEVSEISKKSKMSGMANDGEDEIIWDAFSKEFKSKDDTFEDMNYKKSDAFQGEKNKAFRLAMITDIGGHWALDNIKKGISYGWIRGYDDATFRPDSYITRAEAAVIINRMISRDTDRDKFESSRVRTFIDCNEDDWYYNDIMAAANTIS